MDSTLVLNLATGEESYYDLEPLEALISAAIIEAKETSKLTNPLTRKRYAGKIIFGRETAGIGDLAVRIS